MITDETPFDSCIERTVLFMVITIIATSLICSGCFLVWILILWIW